MAANSKTVNNSLRGLWQSIPDVGGRPCSWGQLREFVSHVPLGESGVAAAASIIEVAVAAGLVEQAQVEQDYALRKIDGEIMILSELAGQKREARVSVSYLLDRWSELPEADRPSHPLLPLVRMYIDHPKSGVHRLKRKGIIPDIAAKRHRIDMSAIIELGRLNSPGLQLRILPELSDTATEKPALISLLDCIAAKHRNSGKTANPSTLPMRLFLEALMMLGTWERDGTLHEKSVPIREVVAEWLSWNPANYRPNMEGSGIALRDAFRYIHNLSFPVADEGWYHPVMISAGSGLRWGLDDHLLLAMRLPPSPNSQAGVGPAIDLSILRSLGKRTLSAYRAYLFLACEWDHFATRNSKAVRPMLEGVMRTPEGQIIDQRGQPVFDESGQPVRNRNHRDAVVDDCLPPEPNPHRERWYPRYEADDLIRLALPQHMLENTRRRSQNIQQAMIALEQVVQANGCQVETLGYGGGFPWRIMPPEGFNKIPVYDGPTAEEWIQRQFP